MSKHKYLKMIPSGLGYLDRLEVCKQPWKPWSIAAFLWKSDLLEGNLLDQLFLQVLDETHMDTVVVIKIEGDPDHLSDS